MRITMHASALAKERLPGLRDPSRGIRRAGVTAVAAGLALLTAACGAGTSSAGSTPSTGTGDASSAYVSDKLGFARCLRAHGVPNYPDPNAAGQEPADTKQLISTPQGQAAVGACSSRGDRIRNDVSAHNQVVRVEYVRFAECMRSHGLPDFPGPVYAEGRVEFVLSASQDGFDPHSPQVLAKARQCEHVLPAGSGLPSVEVTS